MVDVTKLTPQELTELNRFYEKLGQLDVGELEVVQTPMEKMTEDLKQSIAVTRKVKGAQRPKQKKMHWKTAAKRRKEISQQQVRHARKVRGELLAKGAEGWWEHIRGHWYQKGYEVELTKEEWVDVIWPCLQGRIPVIRRYDTNVPVSLENVYVVESGTQNTVLYDGAEWKMRKLGYII